MLIKLKDKEQMSKWIQTINWDFIRWDEVIRLFYDHNQVYDTYSSYMQLKNGEIHDFLDLPSRVLFENKEYEVDADMIVYFHKFTLINIENSSRYVFDVENILEDDESFDEIMKDYVKLQEESQE